MINNIGEKGGNLRYFFEKLFFRNRMFCRYAFIVT